jgi:lipopolysaccharide export system protein LptA
MPRATKLEHTMSMYRGHGRIHRLADSAAAMLTVLLLALPCTQATALPEDREQPIHITADKAVRDEKRGVTIYTGSVEMRQGSMELDADSLTIFHEAEDANKIVARGKPARMRQQPEPDEGLVHAEARVITYLRDRELVKLRIGAYLEREDGTLVTGDSIDYFITQQLVKAESDRSDEDNKVVVVIPPSLHQDEDGEREPSGDSAAAGTGEKTDPPIPASAEDPNEIGEDSVDGAAQGE